MRKPTAVYLLAENRLLREALIRLLSKRSDFRVVGASGYSLTVHREIIAAHPHILLLDSSGLESARVALIATLRTALLDLRILMVDMEPDELTFLTAVRAGVVGYLLKNASAMEVDAAIRAVAVGRAVCPPSLCMVLFRSIVHQMPAPAVVALGADSGLSRREQEAAELLRQRLTNKEIALRLNISEQTVKNHVHRILRKLAVPNRFRISEVIAKQQGDRLVDAAEGAGADSVAPPAFLVKLAR